MTANRDRSLCGDGAARHRIAWHFVAEALEAVRAAGGAVGPLLARQGLADRFGRTVSAEEFGALWLDIADALDDEFFGLAGRPMRCGSFVLLTHCVSHARCFEEALRRALRFLAVTIDDPRGELIVSGGQAQVRLRDHDCMRSAFAYRTYWILLHGLSCWLVGRRIPLRLVDFRCPEPPHGTDYRRFFGAPVNFDTPFSRIAFDAAYLRLPISRNERSLRRFLRGAPANLLVRYRYDAGLVVRIREHLGALPPADWPGFEEMAASLHLPPSTLRHRLRQEGHTFAAVRDDIRRDLALRWLLDSSESVAAIAARLGFAEPSAFHRAFRKWTAQSPGHFRQESAR